MIDLSLSGHWPSSELGQTTRRMADILAPLGPSMSGGLFGIANCWEVRVTELIMVERKKGEEETQGGRLYQLGVNYFLAWERMGVGGNVSL